MLSNIPDEWGPKFEYDGGTVTRTQTGPNFVHASTASHMALVMFTPQPDRQVALNSDRRTVGMAPVGSIEIVPASSEIFARWTVDKQNLLVALDPARLTRLSGAEFGKETFELHPPNLGTTDKNAHMLAQLTRYELENENTSSTECLDALITVFSIYLLRNYSSLNPPEKSVRAGGLGPAAWRRVNDFIQSNLAETLSIERIAAMVRLSPSHFARSFKQTTGQTLHQYLISARLSCARNLIVSTDTPLIEIAQAVGFSSQSHMTALMRRVWQKTPTDYRRAVPLR
jgi:AraC family transcriptional regulator